MLLIFAEELAHPTVVEAEAFVGAYRAAVKAVFARFDRNKLFCSRACPQCQTRWLAPAKQFD